MKENGLLAQQVSLAVSLIAAGLMVVFGVYLCAGLGVAAIVAGGLAGAYGAFFFADWPGESP